VDRGRRKAAAGVASAALAAALLAAPGAGLAQQPATTTTATTPDPAPAQTTPEPPPAVTAPDPGPAVPEPDPAPPAPAPADAVAPPSSRPPALFMPGLPRGLAKVPGALGPSPDHARRRPARENVLGTNRGTDPRAQSDADHGEGGDLGALLAATGAAEVPSFFIDSFAVPPFLLPIYQAAGIEYGVPWQALAAINQIETDYGRNLRVSSAGAVGWMQFLPATFAQFGVDAGGDGRADPYNPADAIFSAANYLRAAGASEDLAAAIFAYNHSPAYVATVLARARLLGGLPDDLVAALTGLAQGRPPVAGPTAALVRPKADARTLRLRTKPGAQVLAVADGVVTGIGRDRRLGRWLALRDVYGNTYTYGALARTARRYPLAPQRPAARPARPIAPLVTLAGPAFTPALASTDWKLRAVQTATPAKAVAHRPLRTGSRVLAGTTLAYAGRVDGATGRLAFEIRPAGRGAPRIQPAPVLAGWRLLRAAAHAPSLLGAGAPAGIGRVLLLDKRELQRAVLGDEDIAIGPCGRRDVRAGRVDRRVLATLKFLALSGLAPTVGGLRCDENTLASGIDIVAVNGVPITGNQGPGSIAEATTRRLLALQGALRPQQLTTRPEHIHIGFTPAAGATTLAARSSDGVLPASSWRRLSRRLGAIVNPAVP